MQFSSTTDTLYLPNEIIRISMCYIKIAYYITDKDHGYT